MFGFNRDMPLRFGAGLNAGHVHQRLEVPLAYSEELVYFPSQLLDWSFLGTTIWPLIQVVWENLFCEPSWANNIDNDSFYLIDPESNPYLDSYRSEGGYPVHFEIQFLLNILVRFLVR